MNKTLLILIVSLLLLPGVFGLTTEENIKLHDEERNPTIITTDKEGLSELEKENNKYIESLKGFSIPKTSMIIPTEENTRKVNLARDPNYYDVPGNNTEQQEGFLIYNGFDFLIPIAIGIPVIIIFFIIVLVLVGRGGSGI